MALYDTVARTVRNEFETPVDTFGISSKCVNSIINSASVSIKWKKQQSYIHETKNLFFLQEIIQSFHSMIKQIIKKLW